VAANYTKRDERRAETIRTIQQWVALGCPPPTLWSATCCICGGVATLEVNKFAGVKFYCEADLPTDAL